MQGIFVQLIVYRILKIIKISIYIWNYQLIVNLY